MIQLSGRLVWQSCLHQGGGTGDSKHDYIEQNMNKKYFRYKDIVPFDSNRVMILPPYTIAGDSEPSDYINASFVSDVILGTSRKYIAAQVNIGFRIFYTWDI